MRKAKKSETLNVVDRMAILVESNELSYNLPITFVFGKPTLSLKVICFNFGHIEAYNTILT
jgi:hypothetical protein